jgi:hypothetical protein
MTNIVKKVLWQKSIGFFGNTQGFIRLKHNEVVAVGQIVKFSLQWCR